MSQDLLELSSKKCISPASSTILLDAWLMQERTPPNQVIASSGTVQAVPSLTLSIRTSNTFFWKERSSRIYIIKRCSSSEVLICTAITVIILFVICVNFCMIYIFYLFLHQLYNIMYPIQNLPFIINNSSLVVVNPHQFQIKML